MPRYCDIVMKGGITSGIVYPAAVVEIAKAFVFKNVGGTSAGAIAAALTAAAERCRCATGTDAGFQRLANVPTWLAQDNRLFNLFVPSTKTASLFKTVVALAGRPRFQPALVAKLVGLAWAYPIASLVGALVGAVFIVALCLQQGVSPWLWWPALVLAIATLLVGVTLGAVVALGLDFLHRLDANEFGMVTGVDEANRANPGALCTWLSNELDRTAGLPGTTTPLTFGMLWDAKREIDAAGPLQLIPGANPDVNLEMITTNVTWGRPYDFPITTRVFFFDPDELRPYFPDYVIDWMVAKARQPDNAREAEHFARHRPKLPLPVMGDLPVIVATRMSLAFPILLASVPLWAADFSTTTADGQPPPLEHVWFSDGGISSNFPITLFDSPLPRWPTFGISLAGLPAGVQPDPDEAKNVSMISSNAAGRLPVFTRFTGVVGFLSAVFGAAQNWADNTQTVLPGYRDRIVTVMLGASEGGLNLDMPPSVLASLQQRGAAAGTLLVQRFGAPSVLAPAKPPAPDWENQRWVRFRSTMGALKDYLTHYTSGARDPEAPDVPYRDLITATQGTPTWSYPLLPGTAGAVAALSDQSVALGDAYGAEPALDDKLPKPSPRLVLRADLRS
ncbi:MAG: hypothetical protein ABR975_01685 [Vulcanimicrobiaceae bacterium]